MPSAASRCLPPGLGKGTVSSSRRQPGLGVSGRRQDGAQVCCGPRGFPRTPPRTLPGGWRELVFYSSPDCTPRLAPRGVSRVPLPDRGSGKDRRTSAAGSAIPGPVIRGITDWHCVLNRSWTHHCPINDLVNQLRLNAQARGGGPIKTPSATPLRVLVRLPRVRATALPRRLSQGARQLPSSAPAALPGAEEHVASDESPRIQPGSSAARWWGFPEPVRLPRCM